MSEPVTPPPPFDPEENGWIAARLNEYADLMEAQGADGFRARAYRTAARQIAALPAPVRELFESGGTKALIALRGIGRGIAGAIAEMLTTGYWQQLDRLKGTLTPEVLFRSIPGIGKTLARRLADKLDAETLEDLEAGLRLGETSVPGLGERRRAAILSALDQMLARLRRGGASRHDEDAPPIEMLLEVDALYRARDAAGTLRRIAPKRFNSADEAWLPIIHAQRGEWHLTALYSNTAQAHELGRTKDWVVI